MDNEKPLWVPSKEDIASSNITKFMNFVNSRYNHNITAYDELYKWSIDYIENFWQALWDFSGIISAGEIRQILEYKKESNQVAPGANWFPGTRINFAENLLKYNDERTAIISYNEYSETRHISYSELRSSAGAIQTSLKSLGIGIGDKIAALTSNIPEAITAMLASTALGAIWSSTSPDFGARGVLDRFSQITPSLMFAVDGYKYGGKIFSCLETINRIHQELPNTKIVIISKVHSREEVFTQLGFTPLFWDDLLTSTSELEFKRLDFNHPVYTMFSSGTTGKPKCIVHGAGGTLLQHYKELALHTNLTRDDKICYFTTCGWMMWNWLVSSLFLGSTVVLYDGNPGYPDLKILWKMLDELQITVFGTSPKFLSSCQDKQITPAEEFNLSSLKAILSTGSPLTDRNFNWVYQSVKRDVRLSSISGGTDIISCFALGNPILPVYIEELQCRGLGMKVEAFDDNAQAVIGEKGELVCTAIFPSMPIYFLNDIDDRIYHKAYFDVYPNVWRHGDYIEITKHGSVKVYGRSDATLNPGGIRIGTAEIYRVVETMDEITDSLAVGLEENGDTSVVLFVVLASGTELNDELVAKIKSLIRNQLTPRHVPKYIKAISEVPVTFNSKKVEISVTKIINGQQPSNKDALANPKSLEQFYDIEFL